LASELLGAICVLSPAEGHKAVLSAMSDYRIAYEESFRFEGLVNSLRLPTIRDDSSGEDSFDPVDEEEGVWEARTASMALANTLINCPESLEERVLLRDEFGRRGLNEIVVVRGHRTNRLTASDLETHRLYDISDRQIHC
jgi:diaphanous 1